MFSAAFSMIGTPRCTEQFWVNDFRFDVVIEASGFVSYAELQNCEFLL
jgi:hypothetical protein